MTRHCTRCSSDVATVQAFFGGFLKVGLDGSTVRLVPARHVHCTAAGKTFCCVLVFHRVQHVTRHFRLRWQKGNKACHKALWQNDIKASHGTSLAKGGYRMSQGFPVKRR